jgi:hypothetical protein
LWGSCQDGPRTSPAAKPEKGGSVKAAPQPRGRNPWRGGSPREHRPLRGLTGRAAVRTLEGNKALKSGFPSSLAVSPWEQTALCSSGQGVVPAHVSCSFGFTAGDRLAHLRGRRAGVRVSRGACGSPHAPLVEWSSCRILRGRPGRALAGSRSSSSLARTSPPREGRTPRYQMAPVSADVRRVAAGWVGSSLFAAAAVAFGSVRGLLRRVSRGSGPSAHPVWRGSGSPSARRHRRPWLIDDFGRRWVVTGSVRRLCPGVPFFGMAVRSGQRTTVRFVGHHQRFIKRVTLGCPRTRGGATCEAFRADPRGRTVGGSPLGGVVLGVSAPRGSMWRLVRHEVSRGTGTCSQGKSRQRVGR